MPITTDPKLIHEQAHTATAVSDKLEPPTAHNQQFHGIKLSQASTKPHYGNQKKALKKD